MAKDLPSAAEPEAEATHAAPLRLALSHKRSKDSLSFAGIFFIVVFLVNIVLLGFAYRDASFGALGIAVVVSPIVNGILALLGLLAMLPLRRRPDFSSAKHMLSAIGMPAGAAILDFIAIANMPLHGC